MHTGMQTGGDRGGDTGGDTDIICMQTGGNTAMHRYGTWVGLKTHTTTPPQPGVRTHARLHQFTMAEWPRRWLSVGRRGRL